MVYALGLIQSWDLKGVRNLAEYEDKSSLGGVENILDVSYMLHWITNLEFPVYDFYVRLVGWYIIGPFVLVEPMIVCDVVCQDALGRFYGPFNLNANGWE